MTPSQPTKNVQMKFEYEPISTFRGRMLTDYIPARENRKNGAKATLRKPNYFPDCHNRHCLNLLVCLLL